MTFILFRVRQISKDRGGESSLMNPSINDECGLLVEGSAFSLYLIFKEPNLRGMWVRSFYFPNPSLEGGRRL